MLLNCLPINSVWKLSCKKRSRTIFCDDSDILVARVSAYHTARQLPTHDAPWQRDFVSPWHRLTKDWACCADALILVHGCIQTCVCLLWFQEGFQAKLPLHRIKWKKGWLWGWEEYSARPSLPCSSLSPLVPPARCHILSLHDMSSLGLQDWIEEIRQWRIFKK